MMSHTLGIVFDILPDGTSEALACAPQRQGGCHLRPGPREPQRWSARLDGGSCVSVKAANFVHLRRGDYKHHLSPWVHQLWEAVAQPTAVWFWRC